MSDVKLGLRNNSSFAFDRGLDDITHKRNDSAPGQFSMPGQQMLLPVEGKVRPQLDSLLSKPTLDSWIDEAIRPDVADAALLAPTAFRANVRQALLTVRRRAEQSRGSSPEEAKILNRCLRVLMEDEDLQDLVQMYRSSLYQG